MASCQYKFSKLVANNTAKIIRLQYGNWRIFYNKLNGFVISIVLGFCHQVLHTSNAKALDFITDILKIAAFC
jgi:hypothetical protein